jgi:K+-transporting ATPase c subunit
MEDQHFDKVFWFVCGLVFLVIVFDIGVIFVPVPTGGQKYADTLVGALNTGALMAGVQYLLGGAPANKKADTVVSGDNTNVNAK